MIVSHKHRFIFLKTAKTGGTSMELALSPFCGPDDILSPLLAHEERARPGAEARNYALGLTRLGIKIPGEVRRRLPRLSGFYDHMPAGQARALLGEKIWRAYFKFTIERNPWDRQVSYYFWHTHGRQTRPDFETFLTSWRERMLHRVRQDNWPIYAIGNQIAVDHVIRYEELPEGVAEICQRIGIAGPVELPRAKSRSRPDREGYRSFYSDRTRALVGRWYAREIATFGYKF